MIHQSQMLDTVHFWIILLDTPSKHIYKMRCEHGARLGLQQCRPLSHQSITSIPDQLQLMAINLLMSQLTVYTPQWICAVCLQFHCRFQAPVEREVSGSGPQLLECFPCTSNQQLINRTCIDITEGLLVKYNTNVLVKNNVHKCVKTRNTVKATVCKHNNASILPYMYSSKIFLH